MAGSRESPGSPSQRPTGANRRTDQEIVQKMPNHNGGRQTALMSDRLQNRRLPTGQEERDFHYLLLGQRGASFLDAKPAG